MRYSLDKISQELGISKTTVSMILNGKARQYAISRKLEEKVKEFCRNKNYAINFHARQMRSKKAESVGILLPDTSGTEMLTPFSDINITEIIGGIAHSAFREGFRFTTQIYSDSYQWRQIDEWINSREVDGIITYGWLPREIIAEIASKKMPVVGIGEDPSQGIPTVCTDDYTGSFQITEMLVACGHRHFIYITGGIRAFPAIERLRGFTSTLDKHGIPFPKSNILSADFREAPAYELMKEKLASKRFKATAVVCANDMMAIGAMRAISETGRRVPQDISVTGADDINLCRYVSPQLTTFSRCLTGLGETAFDLLYKIIDGKTDYNTHITLAPTLIIRDSTTTVN